MEEWSEDDWIEAAAHMASMKYKEDEGSIILIEHSLPPDGPSLMRNESSSSDDDDIGISFEYENSTMSPVTPLDDAFEQMDFNASISEELPRSPSPPLLPQSDATTTDPRSSARSDRKRKSSFRLSWSDSISAVKYFRSEDPPMSVGNLLDELVSDERSQSPNVSCPKISFPREKWRPDLDELVNSLGVEEGNSDSSPPDCHQEDADESLDEVAICVAGEPAPERKQSHLQDYVVNLKEIMSVDPCFPNFNNLFG